MTSARTEDLPPGATYDAHGPRWLLVVAGTGHLAGGGVERRLRAGDAVLVAPGQAAVLTTCTTTRLATSDLAPEHLAHPLPAVLVAEGFAAHHDGVAALVTLCPVVTGCRSSLLTDGYADLVGAAMTTTWLEESGRTVPDEPRTDPVVAAVVAAVGERPGEAWTVERMADLVHLSRSALAERFRRELRRTPAEVLREARMREARVLLRGGARADRVAHLVGYGSAAAFSRAFAAHHGVPPQAWRDAGRASGPRRPQAREGEAAGHGQRGPEAQRRHDAVRVDQQAS